MKIVYKNTKDDIITYGKLLYKKSPTVQQHRKKASNFAAFLALIFAIGIWYLYSHQMMLLWLATSIVWVTYIPLRHKRRYLKNMVETFEKDENRTFFGEHQLTIDESGLTDEIENGVSQVGWNKIEHIEETESHLYIFIDSAMAFVVPQQNISEGNYLEFIKTLKRYHKGEIDENRSKK
jgi:hypothetical protein